MFGPKFEMISNMVDDIVHKPDSIWFGWNKRLCEDSEVEKNTQYIAKN